MSPFPRDDYRELGKYAPDRSPVETDLSDNTNQWGAHPAAMERVRAVTPEDLRGYPEVYADELRDAVALRFDVDPACVTTGVGSDEVIDLAFRASAGANTVASFPGPTFAMIEPFARVNGMAAREIPWPEAIDSPGLLLEGDPSVVYLCRPNNPTGELVDRAWVERLLASRGADGPLVVIDEAYAEFSKDSLIAWAPTTPKLLVTRTASKAYGIAGLRCGYGVAQPECALEIEKSRGPFKVSALATAATAAALRDEGHWLDRTVDECIQNRGRVLDELRERGLRPTDSRASFVLFAAPTRDARADAVAIRAAGVAVRPFTGIPVLGEALRATVGRWEQMEHLLRAIDGLVATAPE